MSGCLPQNAAASSGGPAADVADMDEEGQALFTPKLSWGFAFSKVKKAMLLKAVATELVLKAGVTASSNHAAINRYSAAVIASQKQCIR